MATGRVTVTIDKNALAAARSAAGAAGMSLSEWLSKAAWDRAVEQAARASAVQDRQHGAEFADWDADRVDRMFGEAA